MKKSKVLMFADFIIFLMMAYVILQIVDITTYVIAMAEYETPIVGEVVSYYSSAITYLFYISILAVLCRIYRAKLKVDYAKSKVKADLKIEDKSIENKSTEFINSDAVIKSNVAKNTKEEEVIEKEKPVFEVPGLEIEDKEPKIYREEDLPIVIKSLEPKSAKFMWGEDAPVEVKPKTYTLTELEEQEIAKKLTTAVDNYNKNRNKAAEDKLNAAIKKHEARPKNPSMKMTKDELLKYAAKNSIVVDEEWTKREIFEAINKKMQSRAKSSKSKSTSKKK